MRRLQLRITSAQGHLPLLLGALVIPACSGTTEIGGSGGAGAAGQGGVAGTAAGGGGSGGGFTFPTGGSGGTGGAGGGDPICDYGGTAPPFEVELPPEGVPAELAAICAADLPVESSGAARVTLQKHTQALHLAAGMITVEPALLNQVVGTPTVEVVSAGKSTLQGMLVTNIQPTTNGFSFQASWPQPMYVFPDEWAYMLIKTTLQLDCSDEGGDIRPVESLTYVHLCVEEDESDYRWVSSGDTCTTCYFVCEMAPSPQLSHCEGDALPLAKPLDLTLRTVAAVGRSRILIAEHSGGPGLDYRWEISAGELARLAPDVVTWTVPKGSGDHLIRVAAEGVDTAGVASLPWARAAA